MEANYKSRIEKVRAALKAEGLDALIVADRANTRWLTGFTGSYSLTVIDQREARFFTDSRYGERAEATLPDYKVFVQPTATVDEFYRDIAKKSGYKSAGHEGSITVNQLATLKKYFKGVRLELCDELLVGLRAVKDESEIKSITKAVKLADKMMELAFSLVAVGVTEREISQQIRFGSETLGGDGESFSNIVASGPNSARPHHTAEKRKLRKGDPVTIDLGGVVEGYCSDLTRTPVLGAPSKRFEEIYQVCLTANVEAIKALRPGMTGAQADAIARNIITEAGYGQYFGHGLGHGVGLEIHESPRLSVRSTGDVLVPGHIVTIEPGIYIPGFGGVRIEDYVLITEKGSKVLSRFPKDFHVIEA